MPSKASPVAAADTGRNPEMENSLWSSSLGVRKDMNAGAAPDVAGNCHCVAGRLSDSVRPSFTATPPPPFPARPIAPRKSLSMEAKHWGQGNSFRGASSQESLPPGTTMGDALTFPSPAAFPSLSLSLSLSIVKNDISRSLIYKRDL